MVNKLPLISILVCNYNYGSYIEETLDSIIDQDYQNLEIVIIDDGSQDESVEIIEKYTHNNPEVKITSKYKQKNQGLCFARNDAIKTAKGEYVLFLDSDDTIPVNYVSKMYAFAVKQDADVVYGDVNKFGDESGITDYPAYDPDALLLRNYINISSLIKKSKLGAHQFDLALNRKTLEDYDFWLGLSLMGLNFVKLDGARLNYRVQNKSRNENSASVSARIISFVDIWEYSISKYRQMYPDKIRDDIAFVGLRYQVEQIGKELENLNVTVQKELIPELKKRAEHIESQDRKIQELDTIKSQLEESLARLHDSRWHRTGQWLVMIPLRIKKTIKK